MKKNPSIAHFAKSILDCILKSEMVTISSPMMYQNKVPEELCRRIAKNDKKKTR